MTDKLKEDIVRIRASVDAILAIRDFLTTTPVTSDYAAGMVRAAEIVHATLVEDDNTDDKAGDRKG